MFSTTCKIFSILLFFCSNGFISATSDGIIKDVIKPFSLKLLTFLTPFGEELLLKHTGRSLEVILNTPITVGTATGGVLGNRIYKLHKYEFYWQNGASSVLESRIFYYNSMYFSFENALKYPDGIVDVWVPIETNGDECNPLYSKFEKNMKKIKKPGDCTLINGGVTYAWYEHFNYANVYNTYFGSNYYDPITGKSYPSMITIKLPLKPNSNFMSKDQFKNTFGSLVDCTGKPLDNPLPPVNSTSQVVEDKGICIINLPC